MSSPNPFDEYLRSRLGANDMPPPQGAGDSFDDYLRSRIGRGMSTNAPRVDVPTPDKPVFGHYVTDAERAEMNARMPVVDAEQDATQDKAKPPERSLTPLSDSFAQNQGKAIQSIVGAVGGEMGRALNGAWGKTEGDEVGSVGTGDFLAGLPGLGVGTMAARAISPEINEAFKTPLRDVPVVGGLVRAGEAIGGALNSGADVIGKPARTTLAMLRESNNLARGRIDNPLANASHAVQQAATGWLLGWDNPDIFKAGGTTPEEFDTLFNGWVTNQNTPEQNQRLEEIVNTAAPQEAEKNPVASAVYESAFDPLTYLDAGGLIPQISRIQGLRRAYGAAGDVTDAGKVVGKAGNPLEEILYKMFQPKSIGKGEILSEKAAQIVTPADTTAVARAFRAFKKTPVAQTIDNVQRAIGNIGPYLTDAGRTFDDKLKFLQTMGEATRTGKMSDALMAQMADFGVKNAPDFHTLLRSIGQYDAKGVVDGYRRAMSQVRNLEERVALRGGRTFNAQAATDVREAVGQTKYADVFDRVLKGWETGDLDVTQLRNGIENVAGIQLTADLTDHLAANLAQKAGIAKPNVITNLVNSMKRYEGLLYVGANPGSLVNNVMNDMFTQFRHGAAPMTEKGMNELFARWGLPYNDNLPTTVRGSIDAARGTTSEVKEAAGAYGSAMPNWIRNIPGLKQMSSAFDKSQLLGRMTANLTGRMRYMAQNFNPKLSPALAQHYGAQAGEIESMLKAALNEQEARKILTGDKITWAKFKPQFAEEIRNLLEPLAKRELGITEDAMKDALPLAFMDNLDRALEDMYAAVQKGEDPLAAFRKARGKWFGDDLFGEGTSGAPTPKPPSSPSGGGTGIDPLERFWNRVPSSELNRMGKELQTFQRNYKRAPTVAELEDMLARRNPAPDIAPTQPQPAQAPQPRMAEGGQSGRPDNISQGISPETESSEAAIRAADAGESGAGGRGSAGMDSPVGVGSDDVVGGKPNSIQAAIRQRAAAITEPTIKRDLLREWDALFHEGEPENVARATQRSVNNWSEDVFLEKAKSIVTRAREKGQTWITEMADMFEERAHYVIDQMAAGNPKYNTPEYMERVANGDALVRLLRGGENGFDWTKFDAPYEYRPYESFAQYRKRVSDEFIDRELIGNAAGDTGVGAARAGEGSVPPTSAEVGGVGGGDVVAPPRRDWQAIGEQQSEAMDRAVKLSRHELPGNLPQSMEDAAHELKYELNEGEAGKRISRYDEDEGRIFQSIGSSNPDWYSDLYEKYKVNKKSAEAALDKIIANMGKDKGVNVERLKEVILKRLADGLETPVGRMPPDEDARALLGRNIGKRGDVGNVPPPSEGRMTLDAGEPRILDDMAYINAQKFRDSARKMAEDAANFTDPRLNREAMSAMENVMLDRVEKELANGLPARGQLPPQIEQEIDRYLRQDFMPDLNGVKAGANAAGRLFQDSTVLNYDGAWNIETALLLERPFIHWWLHSALNFSRDFLDHPAMLAFMLRLTNNLYAESNRLVDEGKMPKRFRDRVKISLPFEIPGGLGNTLWVNPLRMAFPYEDVLQLNAKERASYQTVGEDGTIDPNSVVNDTFGIHTPYKLAYNLLTQDDEEFWHSLATIPAVRLFRAVTGNNLGMQSKFDRSYYERAINELLSDSTLTADQANVALLQQGKNKDWQTIQKRAGLENYTARELSALTGLRGMVFTPGEQKYYENKRAKEQAMQDAVARLGGNPNMDPDARHKFFTDRGYYKSDEYQQLRNQFPDTLVGEGYEDGKQLPMEEAQTKRYRAYLVDQIWDKYHSAPELKQKLFAVGLGEEYKDKFLSKKAYDDIPLEALEGIAQMAEVELLQVAGIDPTKPQAFKMAFTTPAQDKAYQALYDEVEQSFGWQAYSAGWDKYYDLKAKNESQARAFLSSAEGQALIAVSDRIKEFYADNPEVARVMEQQGLKKPDTQTTTRDPRGAALAQAVQSAGLNWDVIHRKQDEYNALKTKEEKADYRARNPDLLQYWNIRDSIYGDNDQSFSRTTNTRNVANIERYVKPWGGNWGKPPSVNVAYGDLFSKIRARNVKRQNDPRVLYRPQGAQ